MGATGDNATKELHGDSQGQAGRRKHVILGPVAVHYGQAAKVSEGCDLKVLFTAPNVTSCLMAGAAIFVVYFVIVFMAVCGIAEKRVVEGLRSAIELWRVPAVIVAVVWAAQAFRVVVNKLVERGHSRTSVLHGGFLLLAACCVVPAAIAAIIGVHRGYSVQSYWPGVIMLVGSPCFFAASQRQRRNSRVSAVFWLGVYAFLFLWGRQHWHYFRGSADYEAGRYERALGNFKKQSEAWYVMLAYNTWEPRNMEMLAQTYCQLENFEKAREVYGLIAARYAGEYAQRAQYKSAIIEERLKQFAELEEWLADGHPEPAGMFKRLYDQGLVHRFYEEGAEFTENDKASILCFHIAPIYEWDLDCSARAERIYRKVLEMKTSESCRKSVIEHLHKLMRRDR